MNNVVLFGAGASFGSEHVLPAAPPLGGQLFAQLVRRYPQVWGSLPAHWRAEFERDFEGGMLRVIEAQDHRISPLMQTMALYFASFRPDGSRADLYSLLLAHARRAGVLHTFLFSTLNYECLLELAAVQLGLSLNYGQDPTHPSGSIALWKLHGSCHFIPDRNTVRVSRGASFSPLAAFAIGSDIEILDIPDVVDWLRGNNALYPAMCLFARNKPSQFSPDVISACQHRWAEVVTNAQKIFVIGVRPHPEDEHIWRPIGATSATLYFVGSKGALDAWLPNRSGGETHYLGKEFGSALGTVVEAMK